jgi:hypothetical protein
VYVVCTYKTVKGYELEMTNNYYTLILRDLILLDQYSELAIAETQGPEI